jgi:hypothetical protein
VQHDAQALAAGAEERERVILGSAGVDDDGLVDRAGQVELGGERSRLVDLRRPVPVVVEARLADRHAALVGSEGLELGEVGVVEAGRRVGVAADGDRDLGEVLGDRQRGAA